MKPFTKKIVLESGREFYGYGFGADREATGEIVFNTSMVGYQEILSDPSYTDQMVVMTYPLIGNYGITDEDYETKYPTIGGMIVREYNDLPSNFRYTKTLGEVCEEYGIPCVWGIDTRMLTRIIRDEGTQRVIVVDASMPQEEALRRLKEAPVRRDMVERVSCRKRWFSRTANHRFDVVAVDCGIKHNIIRKLNEKGCNVTVVPYDITAEEVMAFRPDGLFLSNGPGDPTDVMPGAPADLRYLPGTPGDFAGLRSPHLQDEVRTSRRQPPREEPRNGQGRDHEPEPQFCGRYGVAEGHRTDPYAPESAGRYRRRRRMPRRSDFQRPVSSGECARSAGQHLFVR